MNLPGGWPRAGKQRAEVFQNQLANLAPRVCHSRGREAAAIFSLVQANAGTAGETMPLLLLAALALSERTLRRRSIEHFGYGAKTLARILRFQHALTLARASAHGGLAALAADAGYALIRRT
ncbi:hypothetical protein ACU4GD_22685 [Cupriavidus basilensis]